ncbi:hypothetical protein, partial [Frankia sp. Cr1]|uniref:hypothetical protein n=1 Tax=Frankia sp. Cr1 TaxID=3073931 RepID=UPI003A102FE7
GARRRLASLSSAQVEHRYLGLLRLATHPPDIHPRMSVVVPDTPPTAPGRLDQQRGEPLHPPVDRDVVDF